MKNFNENENAAAGLQSVHARNWHFSESFKSNLPQQREIIIHTL